MRQTNISKDIDIDVEHINNFPLTSDEGTKKMKDAFHKEAVLHRNNYINKELMKFKKYQSQVYNLIAQKAKEILPSDNSDIYGLEKRNLQDLKRAIILNSDLSVGYKLGFDELISKLGEIEDISLDDINVMIDHILMVFSTAGVDLTPSDFSYSIAIEKYMETFLNDDFAKGFDDTMKECFDKIFWECPSFINNLRLCIRNLVKKYHKQLDEYVAKEAFNILDKYGLTKDNLLDTYLGRLAQLDDAVAHDDFYHLGMFFNKKKIIADYLRNSSIRTKNFNFFAMHSSFDVISDVDEFYTNIIELEHNLEMYKKYTRYEFLVKDLIAKYEKREENKLVYTNALKEIQKEEAIRDKIYDNYLRSMGKKGLFKKVNLKNAELMQLQMNGQLDKLNTLYDNLADLEMINLINTKVSSTDSIYDLLFLSYHCYGYLEKMFREHFADTDGFDWYKELDSFFEFIYSPYDDLLKNVNAISKPDLTDIITDKYRLLDININKEMLDVDSLDSTIDTAKYIKLVYDITSSKLSLENIDFIIRYRGYAPVKMIEDNSNEVI